MMLGTAASSSIATPTGRLSHTGASSVRKIAMPKLNGIASSSARNEVTSVPYTGASAPNCSVTGFQISRVRKLSLKCANAGHAPMSSAHATPPSSSSTSNAALSVAAWNIRSRSRCPAACRGSIAATVFIADGNLRQRGRTPRHAAHYFTARAKRRHADARGARGLTSRRHP